MRGFRTETVELVEDRRRDAVEVGQNLVVPEAQDNMAYRFELGGPIMVASDHLAGTVLATIEFNDHMMLQAREIDDKSANRSLTLELQPVEASTA